MISWVAIDTDIGDDPKLWELADSIGNSGGIPLESAVGLVTMLFGKLARHAHDGAIGGVSDRLIEEWAKWRGKPGDFATAFRRIFTTDGAVTSWQKRQGKLIDHIEKVKERDRLRKSSRNSTGKSAGIPTGTVPNSTVHKRTTRARAKRGMAEAPPDPRIESVLAHYRTLHPNRKPLDTDKRTIWRALTEFDYTPEALAKAISENAREPWARQRGMHGLTFTLASQERIDNYITVPEPLPEYDEAVHGPMVVDGVISDRMDLMTSPARAAEWARVCRLEGRATA